MPARLVEQGDACYCWLQELAHITPLTFLTLQCIGSDKVLCTNYATAMPIHVQQSSLILMFGGKGSTMSQPTDKEPAPTQAAWKVPVPQGRKCQRETAQPEHWQKW